MDHFPFVLTEKARLWAEYTGIIDKLVEVATEELSQIHDDMIDPDLPPDHPEQLTMFDLCFHTFELGGEEFICTPDEVDGRGVIVIDLCTREVPINGILMPKPETPER